MESFTQPLPETNPIDPDATRFDMPVVKPLFADSDRGEPREASTVMTDTARRQKTEAYWDDPQDRVQPEIDLTSADEARKARISLEEALSRNEQYTLSASATAEDIITMSHAVGAEGDHIAEQYDIDQSKVRQSILQLKGVLAYTQKSSMSEQNEAVDPATYIITALSLARVQEVLADPDNPDFKAAGFAREALKNVPESPESLQYIEKAQILGPHTGELAVAAVMSYQPKAS